MDNLILDLINRQWTSPSLDWLMTLMSSLDVWRIPLVVLLVAAVLLGGFRARMAILCGLIVIGLGDSVVCSSLKKIVARPRPPQIMAGVRVLRFERDGLGSFLKPLKTEMSRPETGVIRGRSFPSAHTMNNFCAALVLTLFYRRWGWLYFIPAACVGYSRIYTGAHWPSDVLISIFIAFGWSLLCLAGLEFLWRRFGSRVLPARFAERSSLFAGAAA